jgi:RNA polymerase sigma-70 factor (ECF subfamily)
MTAMLPSPLPSDEDLVSAFQAGDDQAFAVLYARWRPRASAYARRMLRSSQDAEEVVTDTFVTVVEGRLGAVGSFRTYLFTVLRRRCIDHLRRTKTRTKALPMLREAPESPDLDGQLDQLRNQARLREAMDQLPEECRSMLLLYYGQGLSSKEVAATSGLTDQQTRSKLSYARRLLRNTLGGKR